MKYKKLKSLSLPLLGALLLTQGSLLYAETDTATKNPLEVTPKTLILSNGTATTTSLNPTAPSIDVGTSTLMTTGESIISPPILKQEIKVIVSKLNDIPEEKKALHLSVPLGKISADTVSNLILSSYKTETLIEKVDAFIKRRQADGLAMTSITLARSKTDEAKNELSTANASISELSLLVENFMNENSTSTYKKAVQSKKIEFKSKVEISKKSIQAANQSLRNALLILKPKEISDSADEQQETILIMTASSSSSSVATSTLPVPIKKPIKKEHSQEM